MSRQETKEILHNIDFRVDTLQEPHAGTLPILINLVERLSEENEKLKIEIQKLRDENNRLIRRTGQAENPWQKRKRQRQKHILGKRKKETRRKRGEEAENQEEKDPHRSNQNV